MDLALGEEHVAARASAGGIKSWGANIFGQLGGGTTMDRSRSVDVLGYAGGALAASTSTGSLAASTGDPSGDVALLGILEEMTIELGTLRKKRR